MMEAEFRLGSKDERGGRGLQAEGRAHVEDPKREHLVLTI